MPHWTSDDGRIIGDIVLGSLAYRLLALIAVKAFLEPAAVFIGQRGYRAVDRAVGDRLPNFFSDDESQGSDPSA